MKIGSVSYLLVSSITIATCILYAKLLYYFYNSGSLLYIHLWIQWIKVSPLYRKLSHAVMSIIIFIMIIVTRTIILQIINLGMF